MASSQRRVIIIRNERAQLIKNPSSLILAWMISRDLILHCLLRVEVLDEQRHGTEDGGVEARARLQREQCDHAEARPVPDTQVSATSPPY